jgi:branched-chain amino acid transport system permease protein
MSVPAVGTAKAAAMLALVILVALVPWIGGSDYLTGQISFIALYALLMSSMNLSNGFAGELALGQPALYAAGAYVSCWAAINWNSDILVTIPVGIGAAVVLGLISAGPALRLGHWALAVVSLFFIVIVPDVVNLLPNETGGVNGLAGVPQPTLFGSTLQPDAVYLVTVLATVAWFLLMRNLVLSRHGLAFKAMRQSSELAASVGISVYRLKLAVYLVSSIPVGLAGALYGYQLQYVSVDTFSFSLAVIILVGSMLGGIQSIYGPILGAAVLQYGVLNSGSFNNGALLAYGLLLVFVGLVFPGGAASLVRRYLPRLMGRFRPNRGIQEVTHQAYAHETDVQRDHADVAVGGSAAPATPPVTDGPALEISSVSKSFGGARVLRDVALRAESGKITALIGANGSGKTTLLNVISGYIRPDAGRVVFGGHDIAGLPANRIARLGIRRTFQTPIIPDSMTAIEAVANSRYAADRVSMAAAVLRTPRSRRVHRDDILRAEMALRACGLPANTTEFASAMPLGSRRLIEVARVLAAQATVVLLDEPAAGLESHEMEDLMTVIRSIRDRGIAVVLIEHNFNLIRRLADHVVVLDQGSVVATGSPDEIASDTLVLERYFGGFAPVIPAPMQSS